MSERKRAKRQRDEAAAKRVEAATRVLLASIARELSQVTVFTREDLLHVTAFEHVATITRYRYVCETVRSLLALGMLVDVGRNSLAVKGNAKRAERELEERPHDAFQQTVERLANRHKPGAPFGVMDVVRLWKTDPHLTENTKRTYARLCLAAMARAGGLVVRDDYRYELHPQL